MEDREKEKIRLFQSSMSAIRYKERNPENHVRRRKLTMFQSSMSAIRYKATLSPKESGVPDGVSILYECNKI